MTSFTLHSVRFFTLGLAFAAQSFAAPATGDSATLLMLSSDGKTTVSVEYKQKVQSINAPKNTMAVASTYIQDGTLRFSQVSSEPWVDSTAERILQDCETILGGKLEDVVLPIGIFKTCHQHFEQAGNTRDSYLSNQVPFGTIKILSEAPGLKVIAQLIAFEKK